MLAFAAVASADDYKIISMSHPDLVINGKQAKVGDKFSDDALVKWGNSSQVVRIFNLSKNKQMVMSAKLSSGKTKTIREILSDNMHLSTKEAPLNIQQQAVERVKEYCQLMLEVSGDVEKIELMDKIYDLCENNNVSVFNDLTVPSAKDISINSMPLQQYMMMLTDKFENNVKTSYSGYKYLKTIVQPSPLEGFDAAKYAFVQVKKQVNTGSYQAKMNLHIIVNTATMKVSSTISEDYEDPQSVYLTALEKFNDKDYKAAIPLFKKVSNLQRFSGRNRAKSMLGWIYAEQQEFQKAYDLLRESSAEDPLGGIILASKILMRDDVPVTLQNPTEAGIILRKLSDVRDKDFPTLHLIAKAAIVDDIDILNLKIKIDLPGAELERAIDGLISDPMTNDAFMMRGYFMKGMDGMLTKDTEKKKEALSYVIKAGESLKKANLNKAEFEQWDTQISLIHFFLLQSLGDKEEMMTVLKSIMLEKPYAAGYMALCFVSGKNFPMALDYYRKSAEYGNPFSCYIVSLSYLPIHNPMLGYENILVGWLLKKIPKKFQLNSRKAEIRQQTRQLTRNLLDFTYYLLTDKSLTKSNEEYLKWLQKAIDLGDADAMEDKAFLEIIGQMPGVERNIPHGIELLCQAEQKGIGSRSVQGLHIHGMAVSMETSDSIPYLQTESYKTLKRLADQGNGPAAYFLYTGYLYALNDTVQAMQYLEQSRAAKYFYAMHSYACELYDNKQYDQAFDAFNELTIYPYSAAYGHMGDIEREQRHNYKQALRYYEKGRVEQDYLCYTGLYEMYKEGLGVEKDLVKAEKFIKLAISNYTSDFGVDEKNPDQTLKELMKKRDDINRLIAGESGGATDIAASPIARLNQLLDGTLAEDDRIDQSQTLLKEVFASPKAVVKTVGSNGKTIVSTETAEDFMLRLATLKTEKKMMEVSSKKDKNNKYTELVVQMK